MALRLRTRSRGDEAADFARQLSMLLRTGIPLVEALDVLIRQQTGPLRPVLQQIREQIAAGANLSTALEAHTGWFDAVFRASARVGQLSGRMDHALRDLAGYLRERQATRNRLLSALAYPCLLIVLGTAVVLFLMSYVVPQLLAVLEVSGRPLPTPTRVLKYMSDVLTGHWVSIMATAAVVFIGLSAFYRWPAGRRCCHGFQLRLPLCGPLIRKILIAQFAQMMSLLLENGVPFLDALRLARQCCRHEVLASELEAMHLAVERGSDIAPTLADSRIFPPLVVHLVNVGQKAGELPEMLTQLKEGYETEVRLVVGRFSAVLEPALIVVMAVLVGFVVLATMLPILEITSSIR